MAVPAWIQSQRQARGLCECCGQRQAQTEWAGTGQLICWQCCERKQATALNDAYSGDMLAGDACNGDMYSLAVIELGARAAQ